MPRPKPSLQSPPRKNP
jgi:hypothetical protein